MTILISFFLILAMPVAVIAKEIKHIKIPADTECSECHSAQAEVWENGKHGLMGVKCVVCHGDPDKNFTAKAGIDRCRPCHGEQTTDIMKKLPLKVRDCFLCHDAHSAAVRFHTKGGK